MTKNIDQIAHEKVLIILEASKPVELPDGVDKALERALQPATHGAR